ncbi:MAG: hypothetical protein KGQ42_07955 [Alphaproteobacteria bacterium]|nr:hypothetical protein [Alphaproteobacteria bacterium]MDE2042215.1 hypothetical protein [Alphaproteobacteria bacterium]MDE2339547.1 hypothetical protein [Alphaproteobacteria bacterium]
MNRTALYGVLDAYLAALAAKNPARVDWAKDVRLSENNVMLALGDGVWNTIEKIGSYRLRFADPKSGQVGYFGTVIEPHEESAFTLRLKVNAAGRIAEVEQVIVRDSEYGMTLPGKRFWTKPILEANVQAPSPRAELQRLANGYFETLQLNDGHIRTTFAPDCNRVENGVQTTNNPDFNFIPSARFGCEEQFRLGIYRYDDRLRARRFPLIDEERGLVLAFGFIDHSGRLGEYSWTDGSTHVSPIRRPHSFYLGELFKIDHGMIEQIEANFISVPYHMPSPWDAA